MVTFPNWRISHTVVTFTFLCVYYVANKGSEQKSSTWSRQICMIIVLVDLLIYWEIYKHLYYYK